MSSKDDPKDDSVEEPARKEPKKLKSTEPDLKVVVKYSDTKNGTGSDEQTLEKEYHMFSQILASQSYFVDTALSVAMNERGTRTINFHGSSPVLLEQALAYVEDHRAARRATMEDVVKVVEFYHMYEFS